MSLVCGIFTVTFCLAINLLDLSEEERKEIKIIIWHFFLTPVTLMAFFVQQFCSRQMFLDLGLLFKVQKLHMEDLPCSPEILSLMWVYQILTDVKREQFESTWFIKAVETHDPVMIQI